MAKKRTHPASPTASSARPPAAAASQRSWIFPAIIAAAGGIVYANSLFAPFLFDDRYHIVENTRIRHLFPLSDILFHSSRPVIHLSLALNYAAGGLNPAGYHAFNIAVHIAAALLLYEILRRTFLTTRLRQTWELVASPLAGLAALLWVVHPIQTEAVTYTIQRGESMMGLFYLLTLYCVLRADGSRRELWWYGAAVVSCVLGVACKGVMATAPVVVLLYDRVFLSKSWAELLHRRKLLYAALAATWLVYPVLLAQAPEEWKESAGFDYAGLTPGVYAVTQASVILHYLRLAMWPAGLCLDYGWPAIRGAESVLPIVLILALLAGSLWAWRRSAALGFAAACFWIILIPTSSFIPISDVAVEHRLYLSLAALTALAVAGLAAAGRDRPVTIPRYAWIACALCTVALSAATIRRNSDYSSELTMWQETVRVSPGNPRAQYDLGTALDNAGRLQDAILHYQTAVQLKPTYADALTNLGHDLSRVGKPAEAETYLRRAIAAQPDLAQAHSNLGYALAQQNRNAEAEAEFQRALRLKPAYAEAHNNLAIVLAMGGRTPEAVGHWEQALHFDPQLADAQNNLGYALWQAGRISEALAHYDQALRIRPDYPQAQTSAARLLATAAPPDGGNPERAVTLAESACRSTANRDVGALDALSVSYAAAGRFPDAVRTTETALALARSEGRADLTADFEARLLRYRQQQR